MSLFTVERSSQSSPVESSSEDGDGSDNRSRCSSVDGFWTSKNIAIFLPTQKLWNSAKQASKGPISEHLQQLVSLLRPNDRCSLAVELEAPSANISRYLAIISFTGVQEAEESICLGVEYENRVARVALVVPIYRNTQVKLTGDGRFTLTIGLYFYTFKPVSVQCMWATIQKLHDAIHTASLHNYYHGGVSHTWVSFYQTRLTTDRRTLSDWAYSEDLFPRPDSPGLSRGGGGGTEDPLKQRIVATLRQVMQQSVDLESATSKEIRSQCEARLDLDLKDYRGFIDQQMLTIFGQMEQPSEIFDFLYLGSEWNASNFREMQEKGIGYVLNITCEIDNFFPDYFHYYNIRVWDTSETDLLKHWDDTYQFIKKAIANNSKVLVHCKMGVSRSASTVIAFAMKEYKWQLKEALDFVRGKRECVNPNSGFIQQLRQYEGILGARHNPVWGEKATLRRHVTEVPGPIPPIASRVGSAGTEERDLMAAVIDDNTTAQAMDLATAADDVASAGPFVRTSSISRLRLASSQQRPKSWAGTKREEEMMKQENISLYFKSMVAEQQQLPVGVDDLAAFAAQPVPMASATSGQATAAASTVGNALEAEASMAMPLAPGHRRASAAKSLDTTQSAVHGDQMRENCHSTGAIMIGDASSSSGQRYLSHQQQHRLSTGSTASPISLSFTSQGSSSSAVHHGTDDTAMRTPVADRQPTAQQIETVLAAAASEVGTTGEQAFASSPSPFAGPGSRAGSDGASTSPFAGPSSRAGSEGASTPGDLEHGLHSGDVSATEDTISLTGGDRVPVRQQVASFESRTSSSTTVLPDDGGSPASAPLPLSPHVILLSNTSPWDNPHSDSCSSTQREFSMSPATSPFPDSDHPLSPTVISSDIIGSDIIGSERCDDNENVVTVMETGSSSMVTRRELVEERPQISSVHRRVQSIERYKIFSPIENRSASSTAIGVTTGDLADQDMVSLAIELEPAVAAVTATAAASTVDIPETIPAASPDLTEVETAIVSEPAEAGGVQTEAHVTASMLTSESSGLTSAEDLTPEATLSQAAAASSTTQSGQPEQNSSPAAAAPAPTVTATSTTGTAPGGNMSPQHEDKMTPQSQSTSGSQTVATTSTTSTSKYSFSGFRSESASAVPSTSSSPRSVRRPASSPVSGRPGGRSVSVSGSTSGGGGRRSRTVGHHFSWHSRRIDSGSGTSPVSPSASPPFRHATSSDQPSVHGHSRGSPQSNRHHRSFSFLSPSSRRRTSAGHTNEDNFVTYIPTTSRRNTTSDLKPANFQALVDRFRDLSNSKPKAKPSSGTVDTDGDNVLTTAPTTVAEPPPDGATTAATEPVSAAPVGSAARPDQTIEA